MFESPRGYLRKARKTRELGGLLSLLNLWFFCLWGTGGALVLNMSRHYPIQRNTSALLFSSQPTLSSP